LHYELCSEPCSVDLIDCFWCRLAPRHTRLRCARRVASGLLRLRVEVAAAGRDRAVLVAGTLGVASSAAARDQRDVGSTSSVGRGCTPRPEPPHLPGSTCVQPPHRSTAGTWPAASILCRPRFDRRPERMRRAGIRDVLSSPSKPGHEPCHSRQPESQLRTGPLAGAQHAGDEPEPRSPKPQHGRNREQEPVAPERARGNDRGQREAASRSRPRPRNAPSVMAPAIAVTCHVGRDFPRPTPYSPGRNCSDWRQRSIPTSGNRRHVPNEKPLFQRVAWIRPASHWPLLRHAAPCGRLVYSRELGDERE